MNNLSLKILAFIIGLFLAISASYSSTVISVAGGINLININQSTYLSYKAPDYTELYENTWKGSAATTGGVTGLFIGAELPFAIKEKSFAWQFGLSYYTDLSPYTLRGTTIQGGDSQFSNYPYTYSIQSSQILFDNKFLITLAQHYHPYISMGLGMANNQFTNYQSLSLNNPTEGHNPFTFANHSNTTFAYEIGAGIDVDLDFIESLKGFRAGLGYRYLNLGQVISGRPIPAAVEGLPVDSNIRLKQALSMQQLLLQLTYVF